MKKERKEGSKNIIIDVYCVKSARQDGGGGG